MAYAKIFVVILDLEIYVLNVLSLIYVVSQSLFSAQLKNMFGGLINYALSSVSGP